MADVTYYVALPLQRDDSGSPVAGAAELGLDEVYA